MKSKFAILWKKDYRKIPDYIRLKVNQIREYDLVVGCVKKIAAEEIDSGKYNHLKIRLENGQPSFPPTIIPPPEIGKVSRVNVDGDEIVRRDLPMITKTYSWEAPNYGDWYNGSHDVSIDRRVYRRDLVPPRDIHLNIELVGKEATINIFIFKFSLSEVLHRGDAQFKEQLLFNINLLQENVGRFDVFPSSASIHDYLKTLYVNWEILPPGEKENNIAKILSGFRSPSNEVRSKILDRYELLEKMKPTAFIQGTSGFQRYFGAKFANDLVVFENLDYGNAVYVMYKDWEQLSKLSRIELLGGSYTGFDRIVHIGNWKKMLSNVVKRKLKERKN